MNKEEENEHGKYREKNLPPRRQAAPFHEEDHPPRLILSMNDSSMAALIFSLSCIIAYQQPQNHGSATYSILALAPCYQYFEINIIIITFLRKEIIFNVHKCQSAKPER